MAVQTARPHTPLRLVEAAGRQRRTAPAAIPPAGPQWYGAVMGTGILATLTESMRAELPGGHQVAPILLVIGWLLLIGLSVAFGTRVLLNRNAFRATVRDMAVLPTWGMVAMGLLAVGSATSTVVPAHRPDAAHLAWSTDAVLWSVGTALGVVTALGFGFRLIGRDVGAPTTVWGLAIVPPMVSATTGAGLATRVDAPGARVWLLMVVVGCFFLGLVLGVEVFAVAYRHHWRTAAPALTAATSVWIPLGIVGQSTAAAQVIAAQGRTLGTPAAADAVQQVADVYGFVMLGVGVPLIGWAVRHTVRGFVGRMPFSPGWWSLTFPIGTLALGAHLLGAGSGLTFFTVAGTICCLVLIGTWTLCTVASVAAVCRRLRGA